MQSLWNDQDALEFAADPLALRVYTSRLLGREPKLVLHGGGNTSVKATVANLFGDEERILYVKGSGWDLETIAAPGFAPVRLEVLRRMAELEHLSDAEMVKNQRAAMLDPYAPNPSVEAILHAVIPFDFVDHSHADAVVTLTNSPAGEELVRELYGPRMMIVPYVMPGFILAKEIWRMTREVDWQSLDGMILMNHGVFTFHDDARTSYEKMVEIADRAERYLAEHAPLPERGAEESEVDLLQLARIRRAVAKARGSAVLAELDDAPGSRAFSARSEVAELAGRGPLTPDHVIRTKRAAAIFDTDPEQCLEHFAADYQQYFAAHDDGSLTCLDLAPRWAVWPGHGTLAFGRTLRETGIISDIKAHTLEAIERAELLGGWTALPQRDIFEMEYWELEQAKLQKAGTAPPLQGKVALVSGAASGIGRAAVEALGAAGAVVAALDIEPAIVEMFKAPEVLGLECDVTDEAQLRRAVEATVRRFGGLDTLVLNAGIFPPSAKISDIDPAVWQRCLEINLTSQQRLMQLAIPFLQVGLDPSIIVVASKNVPAPGLGAAAYSVAKAGVTQLARVAALELAPSGVRVNLLHPNGVFDTRIWSPEVLAQRAAHYGLGVEEYKRNNLLGVEVTSRDVAELVVVLAGPLFAKTTGAQLPVDGGNERVV